MMTKQNKNLLYLILGTVLALVPGFLIRYQESIYMWLYNRLTTYPGDLWNFFTNYLGKDAIYPPEYPAGLRFFYEIFRFDQYQNYTWYFTVNAIILTLFAVGITILLWKIICHSERAKRIEESRSVRDPSTLLRFAQDDAKDSSRLRSNNIWYFWILAPSFIFYSFLNYDLPVVFLIVLAVYLFLQKKYYGAIIALAVGTVVKVFPIFLLPIFILKSPKKKWFWLGLTFIAIIVLLNLPYMTQNFQAWIFPYTWQIGSNLSKDPSAGTYWWIFYKYLGNYAGWTSLTLFAGLYLFTYFKLKKASIIDLCLAVIILFLLTDRIYSPQYNLYLLPFLVLASYPINKKAFYLADIPSVFVVLFCFFLKNNPIYLQLIVFIRYVALIWLYVNNYKKIKKSSNVDIKIVK